jgi:hypothetical protein
MLKPPIKPETKAQILVPTVEQPEQNQLVIELGRIVTEGYYDYQALRIAQFNRLRDVVRRKIESIPMDKPEEKKIRDGFLEGKFIDKKVLEYLRQYEIANGIKPHELAYLERTFEVAKDTQATEFKYAAMMGDYMDNEPLYNMWLKNIKGIAAIYSSGLLKNFGYCDRFQYASSLRRYCGYDPDGAKGRVKGQQLHYNPKAKTLIWKITDSFVKFRTETYRDIYDTTKEKELALMEKHGKGKEIIIDGVKKTTVKSLGHADLRAKRKMGEIFLTHYWLIARLLAGLPISNPYPHDKLGHKTFIMPPHSPYPKEWLFKEN